MSGRVLSVRGPSFEEREQIWFATVLELEIQKILKAVGAFEKGVQMSTLVGADDVTIKVVVPLRPEGVDE